MRVIYCHMAYASYGILLRSGLSLVATVIGQQPRLPRRASNEIQGSVEVPRGHKARGGK